MKRLFTIAFWTIAVYGWGQSSVTQQQTNTLINEIDEAVANADTYIAEKERQISLLQQHWQQAPDTEQRYAAAKALWKAYSSFQNDSAVVYADRCRTLAEEDGRQTWKAESYMCLGTQYAKSGYYPEAMNYYRLAEQQLPPGNKPLHEEYLKGCSQLYGDVAAASKDRVLRGKYFHIVDSLRNRIFSESAPNSPLYLRKQVVRLQNEKKYQQAMDYSDRWLQITKPATADYALMAFHRAQLFRHLGDSISYKYWLCTAALTDIRLVNLDQAALWNLAEVLRKEGDIKRAHQYIEASWAFNKRFGARTRSWQVSPVLSAINSNYKEKLEKANNKLTNAVIGISILTLLVLASLIYVGKKRKQLANLNHLLASLNTELSSLNEQLTETNQVKDEYIGKFLSLCAGYVDKLDNYRIMVNRKLKANQTTQLLRMTNSEQLRHDEMQELYDHFDAVFLHLFPTFVDDFNALLRPEERIVPQEANRLNTDLRIFALIRLGIDESSRIAEFLHYSVNSIYSYRARIKNKAAVNRDDFERMVKRIGFRM